MRVLGIETSCDETGVAIYDGDRGLMAHALYSQAHIHAEYGGVVPEIASRDHVRKLLPLIDQCMDQAGCQRDDLDGVAYTAGPGLIGALLVGASLGRALALALDVPAIGVHHMEGHVLAPLLEPDPPQFPFVALLVSGGHTQLMRVDGVGRYALLGESIDDAAGEAFDKSAKLLGLGYPGGPALSALAQQGDPAAFKLPRPLLHSGDLDFSFAGLKTAVMVQARKLLAAAPGSGVPTGEFAGLPLKLRADLAASTEAAIVEVLVKKSVAALEQTGLQRLVVAGGVGANRVLRAQLDKACARNGAMVHYPELDLCTDNGAMIALAAAMRLQSRCQQASAAYAFDVAPRWPLEQLAAS